MKLERSLPGILLLALAVCGCAPRPASPRLAVFHNHLAEMARQRGVSLAEAVAAARSWGIEGIDVFDEFNQGEAEQMLDLGLACGAFVVCVDFATKDDSEKLDRALAFAVKHKASVIMLVPGQVPDGCTREEAWQAARPRLAAFVARAARAGQRVAVEDFDYGRPIVGSAADLRQAFADIPGLGHVFDTGNYDRWGDDPLACATAFRSRIWHLHVKDLSAETPPRSVAAGTGRIPLAALFAEIGKNGFDGWLTIECFGAPDLWMAVETSARTIRDLWAAGPAIR